MTRHTALRNSMVIAACAATVSLGVPSATAESAKSLRQLAEARGVDIGTSIDIEPLRTEPRYREVLNREFNAATTGNSLKWDAVEPQRGQYDWTDGDAVVRHAEQHGQRLHGHVLVWHNQLPSWLTEADLPPEELRSVLREHVSVEVGRYRNRIPAWDVVNEPFNEDGTLRRSMWLNKLGADYIADSLRWARAADPNAKLYLNDYNIEGINAKSDAMYELVRSLKQQGVPIDGVGIQGHLLVGQVPDTMRENIQRFAELGVDVRITELDVRIETPASQQELTDQAADYREVLENCLAVPRCTGVTVWGFTDKHSWIPDTFPGWGAALPFDRSYQPKPAYYGIQRALTENPETGD